MFDMKKHLVFIFNHMHFFLDFLDSDFFRLRCIVTVVFWFNTNVYEPRIDTYDTETILHPPLHSTTPQNLVIIDALRTRRNEPFTLELHEIIRIMYKKLTPVATLTSPPTFMHSKDILSSQYSNKRVNHL